MTTGQPPTPEPSAEKDAGSSSAGLRRFNRIGCVLLPLVLVAVVWVSYRLSARNAERALDAEIERLTAAGIIVPVEDLIPKVPPGERNAADVYEQAFAAFQPPSSQDTELLFGGPSEDPHRLALAVAVLEQNEAYFDLIDEATRLTYCAFPKDWKDPYGSLHQGTELIGAARWQLVRAEALLSRDKPDEALSCAVTTLRIGEHVKREPTIVGQVHAYIAQSIAVPAIGVVLSRGDSSPEACREVFQHLADIDNTPAFVRALKGDLAIFGLPMLDDLRGANYSPEEINALFEFYAWPDALLLSVAGGLLCPEDIMLNYLPYREAIIRSSALPWPDLRSAYSHAIVDLSDEPRLQSIISTALTHPQTDLSIVVTRDSKMAELRAAQFALAAAAYRGEHGDYPDSLDDLTAEGWDLPADPFGGGPLHYRRELSGFVVWSVGPNLMDDNAIEYAGKPMSLEDGAYDIVFRCERSQQAEAVGSSP